MNTPDLSSYKTYRGLPPLAGLATVEEAARPGLGIEECVARLKRLHYAFVRLHEILTARITAEPIYELKSAFSHQAYLCAEHATALRKRVGEMREPPLGLDEVPHEGLAIFFDEILAAPTTAELLVGLYWHAFPAIDAALTRYRADTNPLCDAPSVRLCRFAQLEVADIIAYGRKAVSCLVDDSAHEAMSRWDERLYVCLACAGELDGAAAGGIGAPPTRMHSARPYVYDPVPKRDDRFRDLWNQGVNPEAFLYDPEFEARPKTLMMLLKRIREIDVP